MAKNEKDKQQHTRHNIENLRINNTNPTKKLGVISGAPEG